MTEVLTDYRLIAHIKPVLKSAMRGNTRYQDQVNKKRVVALLVISYLHIVFDP